MDKDIIRLMNVLSARLEQKEGLLSEDESLEVLRGLQTLRGDDFSDEEAKAVITWANRARMDECLLDFVLQGLVAVGANKDGEVVFQITEKGLQHFDDNTDKAG